MIFRRSLVRELTATAIGLFVVLLAILFTQSVIRILARAAGGAVAADGVLALIGFNAMFYLNLLLSVALFLTVLLTLSRWYRDSEMVVWFTSGQSLTACLKPILLFAAPFLVAIVLLSLFLSPWAEQRKIEYERQLESRDEISILSPGLFREFRRAGIVVYVESINPVDGRIRNVFLHSVDDAKDATTVARLGHLVEEPNGDRFVVLEDGRRYEGQPGLGRFPPDRVRQARPAHRARRGARAAHVEQGHSHRGAAGRRRPQRARRTVLAAVGADPRAGADAARDPARLRESADGPLVQPDRRGVPVHALHQLHQHRAEHDRAGQARPVARAC